MEQMTVKNPAEQVACKLVNDAADGGAGDQRGGGELPHRGPGGRPLEHVPVPVPTCALLTAS